MKTKNQYLAVTVLCAFLVSAFPMVPNNSYAAYDEKMFEEHLDEFMKDLKKCRETDKSFFQRHKGKIIGTAAAAVVVAAGTAIIIVSGGTTAPVVAPATAKMASIVGTSAAGAVVVVGSGIVGSGLLAGSITDSLSEGNIKMTPDLENEILTEIEARKHDMLQSFTTKKDVINAMNDITLEVIKNSEKN